MRTLHPIPSKASQRGAALLLTFLVLIVILMIVYQVSRITTTERNEAARTMVETQMDFAIQAAQLENKTILMDDAEQAASAGEGEAPGGEGMPGEGDPAAGEGDGGEGEGGEEEAGPSDSYMDSWATVQQSSIGEVDVISFLVDEDRKFNILALASEDEEEAEKAELIITRILDECRAPTSLDIESSEAAEMARIMRRFLDDRVSGAYPVPRMAGEAEVGDPILPLSLRELMSLDPFEDHHFRDYFDERGNRVYSIEQFLTIYSSPVLGPTGDSELGYAVNVNTAPLPVLAGLFDSREVDPRVWLEILEYRNEEEQADPQADPAEEQFRQNRFNEALPMLQVFTSLDQVEELPSLAAMDPEQRDLVLERLKVESAVFTVTILAKKSTLANANTDSFAMTREEIETEEQAGTDMVRVVRQVLWRQSGEEGPTMQTLLHWSVLDFVPMEYLDVQD